MNTAYASALEKARAGEHIEDDEVCTLLASIEPEDIDFHIGRYDSAIRLQVAVMEARYTGVTYSGNPVVPVSPELARALATDACPAACERCGRRWVHPDNQLTP